MRRALAGLLLLVWALALPLAAPAGEHPPSLDLDIAAPNSKMAVEVSRLTMHLAPELLKLTGKAPKRIRIEVAGDEEAFNARARSLGGPSWAAGLAAPGQGLILLRSPSQLSNPDSFGLVLAHELTHLYLAAALAGKPPPLWLEEGIAMYASQEGGWGRAGEMARGVLMEELIPFKDLARRFPDKERQAALAYAQSYYMVGYLQKEYGPQSIARILKELARGRALTTALKETTGQGLFALERAFKEAMSSRFSWMALLLASGTLWGIIALGAGLALVFRRRAQLKARREDEPGDLEDRPRFRFWPPPPIRGRRVLGPAGLLRRKRRSPRR